MRREKRVTVQCSREGTSWRDPFESTITKGAKGRSSSRCRSSATITVIGFGPAWVDDRARDTIPRIWSEDVRRGEQDIDQTPSPDFTGEQSEVEPSNASPRIVLGSNSCAAF